MSATLAVLTMAKRHHELLLNQVDGLSVGTVPPHIHSVVSMGDRDLTRGRLPLGTDRWRTVVRPVPSDRNALPYAAARNLAAEMAVAEGADLLVFLGGEVIPGSRTLERYLEAMTTASPALPDGPPEGPVVWSGPLLQLPEDSGAGYPFGRLASVAVPAPGVPRLEPGDRTVEPRWELFNGRNFAMTAADFAEIGGFCADYTGHGLEDADFAEKMRRAGGSLIWVGGATAYAQPLPPPEPAVQERTALRHAATWRSRWGTEPVDLVAG